MEAGELPERFDLSSADPLAKRREAMRALLPDVFREDSIDVDALWHEFGDWVDPGPERFGLTWPGKAECMRVIQEPSVGTLVPMHDESVDFDTTQNVIIEGENLEVLKLLQKAYYGKVKLIYIDPPYNTGKEFIYPDNFREGLADYLRYSGQVDAEGFKLSANADTDGRYHSKWLSMMYPRLFLARNLLREDGAICVSIDDNEAANLKLILDEIFGSENFIGVLSVTRAEGGGLAKQMVQGHDYVMVYCRSKESFSPLRRTKDIRGKIVERDGVEFWIEEDWLRKEFGKYGTCHYEEIFDVKGAEAKREVDDKLISGDYVLVPKRNGMHAVGRLREVEGDGSKFYSVVKHLSKDGKARLDELGLGDHFDFPKPVSLLSDLARGATFATKNDGELILDLFAGSGTMADAVFHVNAEDGGNRNFILVQLPEEQDDPTFPTIASITRERVRRAGARFGEGELVPDHVPLDLGFRSFRLTSSNFEVWEPANGGTGDLAERLSLMADHVIPGRLDEDILDELLLKAGYPLTAPVEELALHGVRVWSVAEGALLVCLDRTLNIEAFEQMAVLEPNMILVLDAGFGQDDELKVNALQTIRSHNQNAGSDIVLRVV